MPPALLGLTRYALRTLVGPAAQNGGHPTLINAPLQGVATDSCTFVSH